MPISPVRPEPWPATAGRVSKGPARRVLRPAVVTGLLGLFAALLISSAYTSSPTADEPLHLVRGLSYWWTGDSRLSYAHPPLVNALETLPVALTAEPYDFRAEPSWIRGEVEKVNKAYLAADYGRARAQIIASRWIAILFALLLAVYVYSFCQAFFGWPTAVTALAAICLNPTIIAHGHLITTDIPAALAMTVALGEGLRYLTRPGIKPLLGLAAGVALACCTKYNVVLLVPLLFGAGIVWAHRGMGRFAGISRPRRYARLAAALVLVTVVSMIAVGATHRFERFGWTVAEILAHPEPVNGLTKPYAGQLLEETTILSLLPDDLPIPVPYTYLLGVASVGVQTHIKGHGPGAFFAGRTYYAFNPIYFPVLLLIKTPLPLVVLVMLGAGWLVKRRFRVSPSIGLLIAFPVLFLLAAATSRLNVGIRHVLPVIPILSILAGRVLARLCEGATYVSPRWLGAGAAVLVATTIAAHPHYISYFNLLVGGRANGHEISIVGEDWGQDVAAFADFVHERGLEPLYYVNYAYTDYELRHFVPDRHALSSRGRRPKTPGWVAVHAALWRRARPEKCLPWLKQREPDLVFNHHIYLFRLPE